MPYPTRGTVHIKIIPCNVNLSTFRVVVVALVCLWFAIFTWTTVKTNSNEDNVVPYQTNLQVQHATPRRKGNARSHTGNHAQKVVCMCTVVLSMKIDYSCNWPSKQPLIGGSPTCGICLGQTRRILSMSICVGTCHSVVITIRIQLLQVQHPFHCTLHCIIHVAYLWTVQVQMVRHAQPVTSHPRCVCYVMLSRPQVWHSRWHPNSCVQNRWCYSLTAPGRLEVQTFGKSTGKGWYMYNWSMDNAQDARGRTLRNTDLHTHTHTHTHRQQVALARDLINVFPVNEFAIRTFSSRIYKFPSSGAWLDKTTALQTLNNIRYSSGGTSTNIALRHATDLLKYET